VVWHPRVKAVFLTGYSVGGRGALLVGLRHPDKFDGIAAIVPWMRMPGDRQTILPEIQRRLRSYPHRVFLAFATFDFFFPLSLRDQSALAELGGEQLRRRRYLTDHWFAVVASADDMFRFFDQSRADAGVTVSAAGNH
jgi:pimeloyl-ACP methyl ester carboxylesterase